MKKLIVLFALLFAFQAHAFQDIPGNQVVPVTSTHDLLSGDDLDGVLYNLAVAIQGRVPYLTFTSEVQSIVTAMNIGGLDTNEVIAAVTNQWPNLDTDKTDDVTAIVKGSGDGSVSRNGGTYTINFATSGGGSTIIVGGSGGTTELPAGSVIAFAGASVPTGFLECNGAAVSTNTYPDLYAAIGELYGDGGDGAGAVFFNIPDYRGQFLRGMDNTAGVDPDAASRTDRGDGTVGDVVGSKQATAMQGHKHTDSGHTHPIRRINGDVIESSGFEYTDYTGTGTSAHSSKSGTAKLGNPVEKDNGAVTVSDETRPTNVNVLYCIRHSNPSAEGVVGAIAKHPGSQTIPATTYTTVQAWTDPEDYDPDNDFNPVTGYYTAPVTGIYSVTPSIEGSTAAGTVTYWLVENYPGGGAAPVVGDRYVVVLTTSTPYAGSGSFQISLNASDTLCIVGYSSSGTTDVDAGALSITLIGTP